MEVLQKYERVSRQLINKEKSYFYLHEETPLAVGIKLRKLTGIKMGTFPFTYLGCPVYYGKKCYSHYEDILRKITKRLMGRQNKLLTYGGRYILITHVLQSMPIYLLSAINPTKGVIDLMHRIFAKFFWS